MSKKFEKSRLVSNRMIQYFLYLVILVEVSCGAHVINKSCGFTPRRQLNEVETEVVEDFISWMAMSKEEVIPLLPEDVTPVDFYDVIEQSTVSNYLAVDDCIRGNDSYTVLAHANPIGDRIVIYADAYFWKISTNDYLEQSEITDSNICAEGSNSLWWKRARMFGVLCHENAHLVGIQDHGVVYDVGFACQDAVWDWYTEIDAELCSEGDN